MTTALYTDPVFLEHKLEGHPENSGRLEAIRAELQRRAFWERLKVLPAREATVEEVGLVHRPEYIAQVEAHAKLGKPYLHSVDCAMSEQSYKVALHAAGSVVDAVQRVAKGEVENAFLACRPPGHHAEHQEAMGFCFFNNIALGAKMLLRELGFSKILVFDFDVHHGNGTQHTFEESKEVLFVSIHQDPETCYPGTGFQQERGRGEGLGYTLNFPVPPGTEDLAYENLMKEKVLPACKEFSPDFVLLSAGFDAHKEDPLAQVNLSTKAFSFITHSMLHLAREHAGGRLVSLLEGGYHHAALAETVAEHVRVLAEEAPE